MISYEDISTTHKRFFDDSTITASMLKQYPDPDAFPDRVKWLFDKSDSRASRTILITSYETHKMTTGFKETGVVPPVSYDSPKFDEHNREVFKEERRLKVEWTTHFQDATGLLVADEAQKIKNPHTANATVLYKQKIPRAVLGYGDTIPQFSKGYRLFSRSSATTIIYPS